MPTSHEIKQVLLENAEKIAQLLEEAQLAYKRNPTDENYRKITGLLRQQRTIDERLAQIERGGEA